MLVPAFSGSASVAALALVSRLHSLNQDWRPTRQTSPPNVATTPLPATSVYCSGSFHWIPASLASWRMALAAGWLLWHSVEVAVSSSSASSTPGAGCRRATSRLPSVSVPVLSNTIALILDAISMWETSLMRIPRRAAAAIAAITAEGVAITRAQGQDMTSTAITRLRSRVKNQTRAATMRTVGV